MSDDTPDPLTAEVHALRVDVSRLTTLVETMMNAGIGSSRRIISLNKAAKTYGKSPRFLRALWASGHIRGREVPGRGKSGVELQLVTASIDAFFNKEQRP